ncbi:hypothetical protein [Fictibacillus halophilus]|uniref:hypothetical protein n=1 Tax=Fictibacillus halophilus TaxID=1610490 RepID=UPI001CF9C865|nr:hypothetical protein [Fictibacillus halophilus]
MKEINIHDLIDLILADVSDSEAKIQKMFEWHFERLKTVSTWILGTSVTTMVAIFLNYMNTNSTLSGWFVIITILLGFSISSFGIYLLIKLWKLNKQFISALKLHSEINKMKPFIIKYLQGTR